jgi:hypothetical protein
LHTIGGLQRVQIPLDALLDLLLALVDLTLCEVAIASVGCLELAAVNGNERLREQLQLTAYHNEAATYVADTCAVVTTSVFDAKGLALESGLLKRVEQFLEGPVKELIEDVVYREVKAHLLRDARAAAVKAHLLRDARAAADALASAAKLSSRNGLLSDDAHAQLVAVAAGAAAPGDASPSWFRL